MKETAGSRGTAAGHGASEEGTVKVLALACDYDGTLAHDGVLDDATAAALDRFRASGRRLLMVTGRELPDLEGVCQVLDKFEWLVAENGALLCRPSDHFSQLLCPPASAALAQKLGEARAQPLSVGRAIIATREPHETLVLELIKSLGLELQVIFNKGAVMVLPTGVNKATGLIRALNEMEIDPQNVVGVGDAENDHAFLSLCGVGVAVGNALPMLKERADLVMEGKRGFGVMELIERILASDLAEIRPRAAAAPALVTQ
ncbi:MAG TPA: HAD family hydrolase [Chthoniobacterales bacterium]|nr:HAD family hydrolase [Chthoniobacterales bacterium]